MRKSEQCLSKYFSYGFIVLLAVCLFVWFAGDKVVHNDRLQREARLLSASWQMWKKNTAGADSVILPTYSANNRIGTVVRFRETFLIDGQTHHAELGWTNSCFGPGALLITSNHVFLWRETNGDARILSIPNLNQIPLWWYFTAP
jgi:hypothetical protein